MDKVSGRKREQEKSPGKGYPILSPTKVYRFTPIGHVDDSASTRDSIARIRCLFASRKASVIFSIERKNRYRLPHSRERERDSCHEHRLHRNDADNTFVVTSITRSRTDISNGCLSLVPILWPIFQRVSVWDYSSATIAREKTILYKFVHLCDDHMYIRCTCLKCLLMKTLMVLLYSRTKKDII